MKIINYTVVHCSATQEDHIPTLSDIEIEHCHRKFNGIGHYYFINH